MTYQQFIKYLFSIPKTLYFNLRVLPFRQAIRFPFFVAWNVRLLNLKRGVVRFEDTRLSPLMVALGFNGVEEISPKRSLINIRKGTLVFRGKCNIAEGCVIGVSGGTLVFGNKFSANKNFVVSCNKEITFGDDCMLGWNVFVFDATGHVVFKDGIQKESFKPIHIGNHVWLCAEVHVMKGSHIADGSIVGYRSLVTSKFTEQNILIAGNPAQFVQSNVKWGNFKDLESIGTKQ